MTDNDIELVPGVGARIVGPWAPRFLKAVRAAARLLEIQMIETEGATITLPEDVALSVKLIEEAGRILCERQL